MAANQHINLAWRMNIECDLWCDEKTAQPIRNLELELSVLEILLSNRWI